MFPKWRIRSRSAAGVPERYDLRGPDERLGLSLAFFYCFPHKKTGGKGSWVTGDGPWFSVLIDTSQLCINHKLTFSFLIVLREKQKILKKKAMGQIAVMALYGRRVDGNGNGSYI